MQCLTIEIIDRMDLVVSKQKPGWLAPGLLFLGVATSYQISYSPESSHSHSALRNLTA